MRTSFSRGFMLIVAAVIVAGCAGGADDDRFAGQAVQVAPSDDFEYTVDAKRDAGFYDREGFVTFREEDRLWVFARDSQELAEYHASKELTKHVTLIGVGPGGMTIKAPDRATAIMYLATKNGYTVNVDHERLWVFRDGSDELERLENGEELAKHVTRVNAGPLGTTIKAPDVETLDSYIAAKTGFVTFYVDGRIWVFHEGTVELEAFEKNGWIDKHVTRVGAGPNHMTLKAPDLKTIHDYIVAQPGFFTIVDTDERLWVFRLDSDALAEYYANGMPDKHITLVSAGPMDMTLKAPDKDTADAYLRCVAAAN